MHAEIDVHVSGIRTVPRPDALSASLRWTTRGGWYICGPKTKASQGWKIYVSATPENIRRLLDRIVGLLLVHKVHFKYVRDGRMLWKLNAGAFGYSQVGKAIVIYATVPLEDLVNDLIAAVKPFAGQCPTVPFARHFGSDLPLFYRFGAYRGRTIELGGVKRSDNRMSSDSAIPNGINDPIAPYTSPEQDRSSQIRSFLLKYPVFDVLQQQGKGGVFVGLDISSQAFREVVLKVGYINGGSLGRGVDGCALLRREFRFYGMLEKRGLRRISPQLVDSFDDSRSVILVLERISGASLLERHLNGDLGIDDLESCWRILSTLHESGLYVGDAKLANFHRMDTGEVFLLDFETAGICGEDAQIPVQTFEIRRPKGIDPRASDRLHFLASLAFPYVDPFPDNRIHDLVPLIGHDPSDTVKHWASGKLCGMLRDGSAVSN